MNGQNIIKYQQEELNLMCLTCKEKEIIFFLLLRDKAEKIEYAKILTLEDKTKPNATEFSFFYRNR